jgi:hypothetical protein
VEVLALCLNLASRLMQLRPLNTTAFMKNQSHLIVSALIRQGREHVGYVTCGSLAHGPASMDIWNVAICGAGETDSIMVGQREKRRNSGNEAAPGKSRGEPYPVGWLSTNQAAVKFGDLEPRKFLAVTSRAASFRSMRSRLTRWECRRTCCLLRRYVT